VSGRRIRGLAGTQRDKIDLSVFGDKVLPIAHGSQDFHVTCQTGSGYIAGRLRHEPVKLAETARNTDRQADLVIKLQGFFSLTACDFPPYPPSEG
jgi:hypothetical protein